MDLRVVVLRVPEPVPAVWAAPLCGIERAGLCDEVLGLDLGGVDPVREPEPVPAPEVVVRRRWVVDAWTGAGSATCRRRPGATRIPEGMLFQRRNWLRETPKRSAMVTRVSPRRTM